MRSRGWGTLTSPDSRAAIGLGEEDEDMDDFSFGDPFDDGFVAVTKMGSVAVARIGCTSVRERQATIVRETLTELGRLNGGRLLVGFEEVGGMSAACLGDLLALKEMCEELGGRLVLFGLSENLREALKPTGFLKLLDNTRDQESAMTMLKDRKNRRAAPIPTELSPLGAGMQRRRGAA